MLSLYDELATASFSNSADFHKKSDRAAIDRTGRVDRENQNPDRL
jgi:hypothetical protein